MSIWMILTNVTKLRTSCINTHVNLFELSQYEHTLCNQRMYVCFSKTIISRKKKNKQTNKQMKKCEKKKDKTNWLLHDIYSRMSVIRTPIIQTLRLSGLFSSVPLFSWILIRSRNDPQSFSCPLNKRQMEACDHTGTLNVWYSLKTLDTSQNLKLGHET